MSVWPLETASWATISPPSAVNSSAKTCCSASAYALPSWIVAAVLTPFSLNAHSATALPWNASLCAVRA